MQQPSSTNPKSKRKPRPKSLPAPKASAGKSSQPRTSRRAPADAAAGLSRPASEYARAMADPFTGPLATIPDFPSVPSRRLRVFSRGYFYAGSTGVGYIMVDPYRAATNDGNSIWYSDATYASDALAVSGTGVNTARTNSDYTAAQYGTGALAQGRIVGAGLRVKYSGTELNRGGVLLGITSPNHQTLVNLTFNQIDAFECSARFRPSEKWVTTLYCPVKQDELLYSPVLGSAGGASFSSYTGTPIMAFMIQAPTAAVGSAFQYEFYSVIEVQGVTVRGIMPSISDPTGFSAVQTTAQLTMQRAHDISAPARADMLVQHVGQVASQTISGWGARAANSALSWVSHNGASILSNLAMGALAAI